MGVPLAVSVMFCWPVEVNDPEPLNEIPLTVAVLITYVPIESTVSFKTTALVEFVTVPAVNVPDIIAPVQAPLPPSKEYFAVPLNTPVSVVGV